MHHHAANQSLNDGAVGLSESLLLVTSSSMRNEHCVLALDTDEVDEGNVANGHAVRFPSSEYLNFSRHPLETNLQVEYVHIERGRKTEEEGEG